MQNVPFINTKDHTLYTKTYCFTSTLKAQTCLIEILSEFMLLLWNTNSFIQSYRWMPTLLFIIGLRAPALIKPTGICH